MDLDNSEPISKGENGIAESSTIFDLQKKLTPLEVPSSPPKYIIPENDPSLVSLRSNEPNFIYGILCSGGSWDTYIAYVINPYYSLDVQIMGLPNRGNALMGDVVCVRVNPQSRWSRAPSSPPFRTKAHIASLAYLEKFALKHNLPFPETCEQCKKRRPTGVIVQVLDRSAQSTHVAILSPIKQCSDKDLIFETVSADFPSVEVSKEQVMKYLSLDKLSDFLFELEILVNEKTFKKTFKVTPKLPKARINCIIGNVKDNDVIIMALLRKNRCPVKELDDIPEEMLLTLSNTKENIPSHITDLRETDFVITIDPEGSRDLDDALSIKVTPSGFKVGVHISNVTHFVLPNSELNQEAYKYSETFYSVDKAYPIFPRVLSDQLFSLIPGDPRMTFSCIFEIDFDGNLISQWFGETLINNSCQLNYNEALEIIETGKTKDKIKILPSEIERLNQTEEEVLARVYQDVNHLAEVSSLIEKKIVGKTEINLPSSDISFDFDEKSVISGFHIRQQTKSTRLIQVLMIYCNNLVGNYLYEHFPDRAVIRAQLPLKEGCLKVISDVFHIENDSTELNSDRERKMIKEILENFSMAESFVVKEFLTSNMHASNYVMPSKDPELNHHWCLGISNYTHFTSPIRRYADNLVHRQLRLALSIDAMIKNGKLTSDEMNVFLKENDTQIFFEDPDQMLDHINVKHKNHRTLSRDISFHFLSLYLNRLIDEEYPNITSKADRTIRNLEAVVMHISTFVRFYIPELGIAATLDREDFGEQQFKIHQDKSKNHDNKNLTYTISWNKSSKQRCEEIQGDKENTEPIDFESKNKSSNQVEVIRLLDHTVIHLKIKVKSGLLKMIPILVHPDLRNIPYSKVPHFITPLQ